MKYIVYVSQAKMPLSKEALKQLLTHSRSRNTEDGITGLLLFRYNADVRKGYFIQAIEGPDGVMDALWDRIAQDGRHHTVVTLAEGTREERMFPNWSMGFKNVEAHELAELPGFARIEEQSFWQTLKANGMPEAVDLLHGFYDGG